MAGYSGTPLAKKLGIKPGHSVGLVNAPDAFESALDGLPDSAKVTRTSAHSGEFDVLVCFYPARAALEASFPSLLKRIGPDGSLWLAWPKKSSGVATDLNENHLREIGLPTGLVDNKVCAIDGTWSGLRFVWRLEKRKDIAGARDSAITNRPAPPWQDV